MDIYIKNIRFSFGISKLIGLALGVYTSRELFKKYNGYPILQLDVKLFIFYFSIRI